ncbi:MFS transporter [Pandoraea sp. NPDC087047]|uniref:MFS transporter n=1 Tax=Pandoraea sp. NPDC087047 TaxID=3364390 RepID=UPI0037F30635
MKSVEVSKVSEMSKVSAAMALNGKARTRFLLLLVLASSSPCMALMFTAVGPVLPGLAQHFARGGDGAFAAQLIMTMPGIGIALGGLVTGWAVERLGARALLLGSLLTYALAGFAGFYVDALSVLLFTRLLTGLAAAGCATSTLAIIAQRFEPEQRACILGYQSAAGSAVGLVSLLVAGGVGEAYGWRAPFFLYLLALPVLLVATAVVPAVRSQANAQRPPRQTGHNDRHPLLALLPVYLLIVLVFAAVFMNAVQLSFLLAQSGITSPGVQSWVMATSALACMVGAASYGRVRSWVGDRWIFCICLALMGGGYVLMGSSHLMMPMIVGCGIAAIGGGCVGPYLAVVLLDRAAPSVRGRASGFMFTALYLGDFVNPLVVNPLRASFGIHQAFVLVGAILSFFALVVLFRSAMLHRTSV